MGLMMSLKKEGEEERGRIMRREKRIMRREKRIIRRDREDKDLNLEGFCAGVFLGFRGM